jgi:hypothetical protein
VGYSGLNIGYGIQRLIDAQQRYTQASRVPIYMRLRNFTPPTNELYAQLGYTITPTSGETGTSDIQIDPPPSSRLVSMHNIGMSSGKLRFGARYFVISATFVNAQQAALGLSTPDQLWLCPQFVGIYAYGVLWSVVEYSPEELGGLAVVWQITTNSNELK